ncbi:hypothetical protein FIBSPDRAFT_1053505 [Athelia psychrophila]|uniref:Uncharacterized protein n=1 Tax=Athelia psychrophila TaxID=1759441 RepID=A0A167WU33_9AGAM|nr:hypothetical protein FIBSPDRAFT_1053505 [Fibularhizoctonia sp. CBS 109695]
MPPYCISPCDEARKQGLIAELKANDYDWVIFGFGVWGQPAHTVLFKDIGSTVKNPAPRAKLLFNSTVPPTLMPLGRRSRVSSPFYGAWTLW